MTRLTLTNEIASSFEDNNNQFWNLILENRIEDLLSLLSDESQEKSTFEKILGELFSVGESITGSIACKTNICSRYKRKL